jgi:formylglycine-generating enzyme required for sulfatase activity
MKNISLILAATIALAFLTPLRAQEVTIPDLALNTAVRDALGKPVGPITQQDMLGLTGLSAIFRGITNVQGLEFAQNLVALDLQDNRITNVNAITNLTKLVILDLSENRFPQLTLPAGMTNLTTLRLEFGALTNITFPVGLTKLASLRLGSNQLPSLALPADMTNLNILSVYLNQLTSISLPPTLTSLTNLSLDGNLLSTLDLPAGMTKLDTLIASGNHLTSFSAPTDLTNLLFLRLNDNQITNVTLPPDVKKLVGLFTDANPLASVVLSEPLAAAGMVSAVASFRMQHIDVFTYPLGAQLIRPLPIIGAFKIAVTGPPGVYTIFGSTNMSTWSAIGVAHNPLGSVNFHDLKANASPRKFYRAQFQTPPINMVFIPANTFKLGTPTNEVNRRTDEGPQTTVSISRGFWIGKYEVTQREYLAVTGSNPSGFTGDLNRPVESVSWLDATNYCFLLTARELAAGRINLGSHFRLPTEAEWECAARGGTSTRFSYGDDLNFTSLTDNAWYFANSGIKTHPVGQKLPNPFGLYDMEGNVLEWTQDWYGPYPGGSVVDPQGPASNPQGVKVIRGGAWDSFESDCRSGRRQTEGVSPFIHDSILGFRVVLVTDS